MQSPKQLQEIAMYFVLANPTPATQKCLPTLTFVVFNRDEIYRQNFFFHSILRSNSCLSRLLLPPHDKEILSRLYIAQRLPTTACRTKGISRLYALANCH